MSETNRTNSGSGPATSAPDSRPRDIASILSGHQSRLEAVFRHLGMRATPESKGSSRFYVELHPIEPMEDGTDSNANTSEASELCSRIQQRMISRGGVEFSKSNAQDGFSLEMSLFSQRHGDPVVRENASKVSALIVSLGCLDLAVEKDDNGQLFVVTSASATGQAREQSQKLLAKLTGADPTPTSVSEDETAK
ncbi:hypothetical protein EHS25_000675 [Saitozyma podzolica]|uniref:Uncharacterized protein n=1 Tax=Saitozyma podzolica TaxID=1890683 RepID=A0A427YWR4_9TREE|nr:hypothetical protein EHS25_000675 [Saitozyma podzolica]